MTNKIKNIIKECTIFILIYAFTIMLSYIFKFNFNSQPEAFFRISILVIFLTGIILTIIDAIKSHSKSLCYDLIAVVVILAFIIGGMLGISFLTSKLLNMDFYITNECITFVLCFIPFMFVNSKDPFSIW